MWCYRQSGTEPTLDEVMHEPVIRLMMERDHVTEEALVRIINIARQHLGRTHEQQRLRAGQLLSDPLLDEWSSCLEEAGGSALCARWVSNPLGRRPGHQ